LPDTEAVEIKGATDGSGKGVAGHAGGLRDSELAKMPGGRAGIPSLSQLPNYNPG
jgi:hypothetical protein